jgi:hypothetical protein
VRVCIYVCVYMCVCLCVYVHVCICARVYMFVNVIRSCEGMFQFGNATVL